MGVSIKVLAAALLIGLPSLCLAEVNGKWRTAGYALLQESWGEHRQYDCKVDISVQTMPTLLKYVKDVSCRGDAAKHVEIEVKRAGERLIYDGQEVGTITDHQIRYSFYDRSQPQFPRGFNLSLDVYGDTLQVDDMFVFGRAGNYIRLRGTLKSL